jgi:chromosome segregation ATPase
MATNEEVEEQRDRVHELRARLDEAKSGGSTSQQELENDIVLTQLQAEELRLAAEIAEVEHRNDAAVQERSATPLASAKEQMAVAVAQQKAVANTITADKKAAAPAAPKTTSADEPKVEG